MPGGVSELFTDSNCSVGPHSAPTPGSVSPDLFRGEFQCQATQASTQNRTGHDRLHALHIDLGRGIQRDRRVQGLVFAARGAVRPAGRLTVPRASMPLLAFTPLAHSHIVSVEVVGK